MAQQYELHLQRKMSKLSVFFFKQQYFTGETLHIHLAGNIYPPVILASPTAHPLRVRHSSFSEPPAAR